MKPAENDPKAGHDELMKLQRKAAAGSGSNARANKATGIKSHPGSGAGIRTPPKAIKKKS